MAVKAHSCQQPRPAPSRWQATDLLPGGHSLQGGLHAPFDFQLHWRDGVGSGPVLANPDAMNGLGRTSAQFALEHPDGTNFQLAALIQALSRQEALPDWATLPDPLPSFRDLPTLAEPMQQVHETTGHIQHIMAQMEQEAARKVLSEQLDQLYKPFYSLHSQPAIPQVAIPAHEMVPFAVSSGCRSADHVEGKPQLLAPSQQKAGKPNPPRNAWSAELRKAIAAASSSKGASSDKEREPRVAGGWSDYSSACFTAGSQQLPAKHIVEVLLEHRASSDQTSAATKLPSDVAQCLATDGGSLESSSGYKHCRQAGGQGSTWTDAIGDKRARHDGGQQALHDALLQEPLASKDEDASKAPLSRGEKEKRRTLTEKRRRERISESLKALQKVTPQPTSHREDTAGMLERAREYMLFLESQVQVGFELV
eukprot:SM000205S06210  [mRNA]  locus=s205:60750:62961:- [translate_table: standard]